MAPAPQDWRLYIVQELCDGGPLRDALGTLSRGGMQPINRGGMGGGRGALCAHGTMRIGTVHPHALKQCMGRTRRCSGVVPSLLPQTLPPGPTNGRYKPSKFPS